MCRPTAPEVSDFWRSNWAGLMILGIVTMIRGVFYTPNFIPEAHRIPALENHLPLQVWATLWISVGAAALFAVATRRFMAPMVGATLGIHMLWATLYLTAWVTSISDRGFVTALAYGTVAVLGLWAFYRGHRSPAPPRRTEPEEADHD